MEVGEEDADREGQLCMTGVRGAGSVDRSEVTCAKTESQVFDFKYRLPSLRGVVEYTINAICSDQWAPTPTHTHTHAQTQTQTQTHTHTHTHTRTHTHTISTIHMCQMSTMLKAAVYQKQKAKQSQASRVIQHPICGFLVDDSDP